MTYAASAARADTRPVIVMEITLPKCAHAHATSPCTASSGAQQCYNTKTTCRDLSNYDGSDSTVWKFCGVSDAIPDHLPVIASHNFTPAKLDYHFGVGLLAEMTLTLADPDILDDDKADPYALARQSVAGYVRPSSTFFRRFRARNAYLQGKELTIYTGFLKPGETYDTANMKKRAYVLDKYVPAQRDGRVQIVARDPLNLASDDRAQCPPEAGAYVETGINTSPAVSLTFNYTKDVTAYVGVGGYLKIDDEVVQIDAVTSSSATSMTVDISRGLLGTDAAAHDAGATVSWVYSQALVQPHLIIQDLLENFVPNFDPSWITIADWEAVVDEFNPLYLLTAYIVEPAGVVELIREICEACMLYVYWSETEQQIKLKSFVPDELSSNLDTLTDDDLVSIKINEEPRRWYSQAGIYFAPRETFDNSISDSEFVEIAFNGTLEEEQPQIYQLQTRWMNASNTNNASTTVSRLMLGTNRPPTVYTLVVDASRDYKIADSLNVEVEEHVDTTGAPLRQQVRVLSSRHIKGGTQIQLECASIYVTTRLFRIAPNDLTGDYSTATDEEREQYGYLCDSAGEMTNGDEGYRLI